MKKAITVFTTLMLMVAFVVTGQAQTLLKDLEPVANVSSNPQNFVTVNGIMYFETTGGNTYVHRLWRSDGTAAGTTILKDSLITTNVGGVVTLIGVNGTLF